MSAPSSFFTELRRRHVYRVAVAYVIVGWLLISTAVSVVSTIVPAISAGRCSIREAISYE